MSSEPAFGGATYSAALDGSRLARQLESVRKIMSDSVWRTLSEVEAETGHPQASISARLRDLRKPRHGSLTVERRRRGEAAAGLFEYRVLPGSDLFGGVA
jgi:hypothetical protein